MKILSELAIRVMTTAKTNSGMLNFVFLLMLLFLKKKKASSPSAFQAFFETFGGYLKITRNIKK